MKKGIIIASFGTTHEDTRVKCIENLEKDIINEFKDFLIERAFTSRMVISKLKNNGMDIKNEIEALESMKANGINEENIFIQPLHVIPGFEFEKLTSLNSGRVGKPLLYSKEDLDYIVDNLEIEVKEDEAIILFGHGSDHKAEQVYLQLQETFREKGKTNVFICNVEGSITIDKVIDEIKELKPSQVILQPFMIVAGEHAKVDMASLEDGSLRRVLEDNGFKVEARLIGLGELESISNLFIKHLKEILEA